MTRTRPGIEPYRFSADVLRAILTLIMEVVALATCAFTIGYVRSAGTWSHRAFNGAVWAAITVLALVLIGIVVTISVRSADRSDRG